MHESSDWSPVLFRSDEFMQRCRIVSGVCEQPGHVASSAVQVGWLLVIFLLASYVAACAWLARPAPRRPHRCTRDWRRPGRRLPSAPRRQHTSAGVASRGWRLHGKTPPIVAAADTYKGGGGRAHSSTDHTFYQAGACRPCMEPATPIAEEENG